MLYEKGEAAVRASGILYTFVRLTGFMSNLLAWAHLVNAESVVRTSTADGRRPFIHTADIAAVVAKVLTTRSQDGKTLAIIGPEAVNFTRSQKGSDR